MAAPHLSTKRIQIDKANATMMAIIATAAFVVVFSLMATRALFSLSRYQQKVISEKQVAVKTLKANVTASQSLETAFKTFDGSPSLLGTQDSNAKLVLDALPSKYDFPALATSLEKILIDGGYQIDSITGTDDEEKQTAAASSAPAVVEMPFSLGVTANYPSVQKLIGDMSRSIRPFNIRTLSLTGNDGALKVVVEAKTYFQPAIDLTPQTKVVK